jgi:hypothetical protein
MHSNKAREAIADWIAEELLRNQFFAISRMPREEAEQKSKYNPPGCKREAASREREAAKWTRKRDL